MKYSSPAFRFYADDFIAGVVDMTQKEVGAYILLLAHGWNTHGLDASDFSRLKRLAKGDISKHVLAKFKLKNGKLFNKRQEEERKIQSAFRRKQAENGAKGGRPIINPSLSSGLQKDEPKKSLPSPSPSPSPSIKGGTTKLPSSDKRRFTRAQTELTARFHQVLNGQWENDRQKWMGRIKHKEAKAERVIAEVECAVKESRIKKSVAEFAEQTWKDFK